MGSFLTAVVQTLLSLNGWPVYLVVGVLAFVESAAFVGMVLPGETAMVVAGILAARGNISLPVILTVSIVAAVGGDQVGYLVGRRFGPHLRRSRLGQRVGDQRWERAQEAVTRHGGWAVVGARWVGVLRALVPTVAGTIGMPYRRFLLANLLGGSSWAVVAVLLGYLAGGSVRTAQDLLGRTSVIGVVIMAIFLASLLLRHRRGQTSTPDLEGPLTARLTGGATPRRRIAVAAGAVAAVGSLGVFALIDGARESVDLALYDPVVTSGAVVWRTPALTVVAQSLTFLGSTLSLGALSLLLVLWLGLRRRAWRWAVAVAGTMFASAALTVLVKTVVARDRPSWSLVLGPPDPGFAFPSGHTLNATVFFGLVAALVLTRARSLWMGAAVVGSWLVVSVAIGLSRIYLGYHWLTDVLGGWALGSVVLAAAALAALAWQTLRLRTGSRDLGPAATA